jgi:hypothetical protein
MASQAEEMRMITRTAAFSRLVDNVAKGSVDALHAMHEASFLEVLERAKDSYTVELEKIDYLTMRE